MPEGWPAFPFSNYAAQGLATRRLLLEPIAARHAAELFNGLRAAVIYEWISTPLPESLEKLAADFNRLESGWSPERDERWLNWILRRRLDGACLGRIDLTIAKDGSVQFGYVILPVFWSNGYATEAVSEVIAHLEAVGAGPFRATVTAGNRASARVLEKCGFSLRRVLPANDIIRGQSVDDWEYLKPGGA